MPITAIVPYIDVVDADIYFSTRPNSTLWDASTDDEKLNALISATMAINNLRYIGLPAVADQVNKFPRFLAVTKVNLTILDGTATTPDAILMACCEIAITLLDGYDPEFAEQELKVVTSSYSTVRSTYDSTVRLDNVRAGIASVVAWRLLFPYLMPFRTFRMKRVT